MSSLNDTEFLSRLNGGILDIFDHIENSSNKKVAITSKLVRIDSYLLIRKLL